MKAFIAVCAVALLSGCTKYYKAGASQQDYDRDDTACTAESYQVAPVTLGSATIGRGYVAPGYSTCTGDYGVVNCTTTGGAYVAPTQLTFDQNTAARRSLYRSCMYSRGWTEKSD